MPGTKVVLDKILNKSMPDLTSMVMCLEDAIQEKDLSEAENNVIQHLDKIAKALTAGAITHNDIPLTFIRVRNPEQFRSFAARLASSQAEVLSGFVFPKFYTLHNGYCIYQ